MRLCNNDETREIAGFEAFPGSLTVIGCDGAGSILASSLLSKRVAFFLTIRMRQQQWFPIAIELVNEKISVIYGKRCAGRNCRRCEGIGIVPYYAYVDHGRCFSCKGTGKQQLKQREYWKYNGMKPT